MSLDYPHIRKACICPLCFHAKQAGQLTCYSCQAGCYSANVREKLDAAEARKRNLERAPLRPAHLTTGGL